MLICRTPAEMRAANVGLRKTSGTLGLVPTMGALHAGHLSLVASAKAECGAVVASIFVNPLQFAPGEDFDKYPRAFEDDCAKLESAGVHALFAPPASEMIVPGAVTFVEVAGIGDRLDGASRPGHFRGVATIVAKLFHVVGPDKAYFGQKDAAQVAVLRRMVQDLNFPVEMVVCPIVREPDGLAMSSRNRYLSAEERMQARVVPRALNAAEMLIKQSERRAETLCAAMLAAFAQEPLVRVDYVDVVDAATLEPVAEVSEGSLIAVAAWVGTTRLIDNFLVGPLA
jgi:pantoate--beta-alanine ligase